MSFSQANWVTSTFKREFLWVNNFPLPLNILGYFQSQLGHKIHVQILGVIMEKLFFMSAFAGLQGSFHLFFYFN